MATDFNKEMAIVGEKYLIHLYLRNIWVLKKLLKCHIGDLVKKIIHHTVMNPTYLEVGGPGRMEPINETNQSLMKKPTLLKLQTIYTLGVKRGHLSNVLMNLSCRQSQRQATCG